MPMGPYADWDDCIAKNRDKHNPKAYCGWIKHRIEGARTRHAYSPDQPRVPAGHGHESGRWVGKAGGGLATIESPAHRVPEAPPETRPVLVPELFGGIKGVTPEEFKASLADRIAELKAKIARQRARQADYQSSHATRSAEVLGELIADDEAALASLEQAHRAVGIPWADDEPMAMPLVFHGTTSEALTAIRQAGLRPAGGRGADTWAIAHGVEYGLGQPPAEMLRQGKTHVYFTSDRDEAARFADFATEMNPGSHAITLAIDVPGTATAAHAIGRDTFSGALMFQGVIPPSWIRVVGRDGNLYRINAQGRYWAVVIVDGADDRPAVENPLSRTATYNPDQPRVPAGSPEGGRWSDDGGSVAPPTPVGQQIVDRIYASGVGSDYVHELYSDDPLDAMATNFDLDTVRDEDIAYARAVIQQRSQEMLRTKVGESFKAYRGITGRETGATVSLSLDRGVAERATPLSYRTRGETHGSVREFQIRLADVLSYSEAIGRGTFAEEEIVVLRKVLRGLQGRPRRAHLPGQHDQQTHGNRDRSGDTATLYHGTRDRAARSIAREGIRADLAGRVWPDFAKPGTTYLTTNWDTAAGWSAGAGAEDHDTLRAVVEIVVPRPELATFAPDTNLRDRSDWEHHGDIPASWVRAIEIRMPGLGGVGGEWIRYRRLPDGSLTEPVEVKHLATGRTLYAVLFFKETAVTREPRSLILRGATTTANLRTAAYEGRDHLVVPVVALVGDATIWPVNAPTPEFVPAEALSVAPASWNGRPVCNGHPALRGTQVSANNPRTLESSKIGIVFNAAVAKGKLLVEAWIDPALVATLGGTALRTLERIRAGEAIEVSIGAFVVTEEKHGVDKRGRKYSLVWTDIYPDHLAFLAEGEEGACSLAMGCGAPRAAAVHRIVGDEIEWEGAMATIRTAGSVPKNVSTTLAPRGTAWSRPALQDFTSQSWEALSAEERRRIAGHFAWAAASPPEAYGDLKFPHHRPSDGAVVFRGVVQALGRLNQADIPAGDVAAVRAHLEAHRAAFNAGQRAAADSATRLDALSAALATALDDTDHALVEACGPAGLAALLMGDDVPDVPLREALATALHAADPDFAWIEDVDPEARTVIYADGVETWQREFTVGDDATATLAADKTQIQRGPRWAVATATEEGRMAQARTAAGCGCGSKPSSETHTAATSPGGNMTKGERIAALLAHPRTVFTAADQKMLEGLEDDRLAQFEQRLAAIETDVKTAKDEATAATEAKTKAEADKETAERMVAAASKPKSHDEWMAAAPPSIRALVSNAERVEAQRRDAHVAALKDAQSEFTEDELTKMPVEQLERLAHLLGVSSAEPTEFIGRGLPRAAGTTPAALPPSGWAKSN